MAKQSEYDQVRLIAGLLAPGEDRAGEVCPFCGGGRTREKSLSVSKLPSGVSLYICHRAQCRRKGRVDGGVGLHERPETSPASDEFTPKLFGGVLEDVPREIGDTLRERFGLTQADLNFGSVRWNSDYQRTVWPVLASNGLVRGYELRRHSTQGGQKTLHYRHSPDVWQGHYSNTIEDRTSLAVVVEDLVSALKVGRQFYAISLMGSHLDFDRLVDIMSISENIYLALDRDAVDKAKGFVERYQFLCPTLKLVPLQVDMKYMSDADISRCIST